MREKLRGDGDAEVAASGGLLGRADELAAAGIGKTRLLEAASALARDAGFRILSARCGELEQEFAFGAVRQLLERPLREADTGNDLLAGAPKRRLRCSSPPAARMWPTAAPSPSSTGCTG